MNQKYNPHPKTADLLRWTLERINAVPYPISLRWAFYRIVQEKGFTKKDYRRFIKWTSRARKAKWEGWHPTTFIDDTRKATWRGTGYDDWDTWVTHFKDEKPHYDAINEQEYIVQLWFEAAAMKSQFEYYARPLRISTVPFRGDATIEFKWRIAQKLVSLREWYPDKKIMILYFGDCDKKGESIPEDAIKDIRLWSKIDFGYERCGLSLSQAKEFNLPENPLKPGEYQWESLDEEQAQKLIITNIEKYWGDGPIKLLEEKEAEDAIRWQMLLKWKMKGD